MKKRLHAIAGIVGFLTILTFWTSTVYSEVFGTEDMIRTVKTMILSGMIVLIPAMAVAGGTGMALGKRRKDPHALAKKKRMPVIAANGLLVLMPAAFYLQAKASAGSFDIWFYTIQAIELVAGAGNLIMMGLNIRDGRRLTSRLRQR